MNNDSSARRLQIFADPAALARAAAELLTRRAAEAVRAEGRALIALSGGSTPKTLYGLLADEPAFRDRLPWAQTHFFFGDERTVPPADKDSNFRMTKEAMLDKLGDLLPAANVHRIRGEDPDHAKAAADYSAEVLSAVGKDRPQFDVILLGMGPEGHTASIFPGTTPLRETEPVVSVFVEKMATYRVTFTPPLLNKAKTILFLVAGKDKAETLAAVLEGPTEPDRFPVQGINCTAAGGETLWLLDEAAAAKLRQPPAAP